MKKSKNMWNRFVNVVSGVGGVNEDDEFETDEYEDELEYEEERVTTPYSCRSTDPYQRQLYADSGQTAAHGHRRTGTSMILRALLITSAT